MTENPTRTVYQGSIEIGEVVGLFKEHIVVIFLSVILGGGLAFVYLRYVPPTYMSQALIEVSEDDVGHAFNMDSPDLLKTIELKIATQAVLLGVVKAIGLSDDLNFLPARSKPYSETELVQILGQRVSVTTLRGSRLLSIAAQDTNPVRAKRIVRGLIDQIFIQSLEERRKGAGNLRDLLLAEARRVDKALGASEEKLQSYREKYNVVSLTENQNIVIERLKDLNQRVTVAKYARLALEADWNQITQLQGSQDEDLIGVKSIAENSEVSDLRRQLATQRATIASLAQRYGPLYPSMIQAQSQVEEIKSALKRAVQKSVDSIRRSYEAAKTTEDSVEREFVAQQAAALELDRLGIPYHALEREVAANSAAYQQVIERLKQTGVSDALMPAQTVNGKNVRVVEEPLVPTSPIKPSRKLVLALGLVAGLFLGFLLALTERMLNNTVSTTEAAELLLGLKVFTAVPRARRRSLRKWPAVLKDPASGQAEAFRSLRTSLSLLDGGEGKCVLFASTLSREGKTYCALNYASALTQQGYRTLLIDGDLRCPRLQLLYGNANTPLGISECLRDNSLFADAPQRTVINRLLILGDLKRRVGGDELFGNGRLDNILKQALLTFDRVIIDTSPLGAVSDSLYLAKHASIICVVVQAGKTPIRSIKKTCQQLQSVAKQANIGIILNKTSNGRDAKHSYGDELPEFIISS